ncbi:MAG: rhamnan synthesis F family protein, partial [Dermatophilaceae bacterium]
LFYDDSGIVDDYVLYKLAALRRHVDPIFVVSNSPLTHDGRHRLEQVADTVWVRENTGFDVWAYKEALDVLGDERLAEFDELVFMNYTFFGPIYPFEETFERMDTEELDFWGLTEHKGERGSYNGAERTLSPHLQSHWIAVRKRLFQSIEFQKYWSTMPIITSYDESIMQHESRFTEYFSSRGFRYQVAFPADNYPSDHPLFENITLLLADRCPIIKRRIFFHEPTYLDHKAIIARRAMELIEKTDYPVDLIWRNVVRSVEPRTLYTNLSMLSVLPDGKHAEVTEPAPRICVIAHVYYVDMIDEMMSYISRIPVPYDLVVTTDSRAKQDVIGCAIDKYEVGNVDVRVLESNRGRETSAFLIGCRDVLESRKYDLICKVHSKKSAHNTYNSGVLFKQHMFDNLLSSPAYVSMMLKMFGREPTLGMVFPPVVNIGFPTLGHAWFTNRPAAVKLADELGIRTQFDRSTPVAPYGGMFWCRPEAVAPIVRHPWTWDDFPDRAQWVDGGLAHVIERLYAYAAMQGGYHVRCAMNADWAEINYTFLEYKLQRISSMLPAYTQEQANYLKRVTTEGP